MSRIQPGSNEYFKANQDEFKHIKEISTGHKNWFVKKACNVMKSVRKAIYGKDKLKDEYEARLKKVANSIKANDYKKKIDEFVDGIVNNSQNEAYKAFKAGLPQLTALLERNVDFPDELGNQPDLNKAINAIKGDLRVDACSAFAAMPEILSKIDTTNADTDFLQFVQNLKDQFTKDDSETKIHLNSNLKEITNAMKWDWKKNTSVAPLALVMNEEQKKNVELIEHIREWRKEMQGQQDALLGALPLPLIKVKADDVVTTPKNLLKRYGYFTDQIDEVKKVSKRQMSEVSSKAKLEASLLSFMSGKVIKEVEKAEKEVAETKNPILELKEAISNGKKDVDELGSKLRWMRWNNEEGTDKYKITEANRQGLIEDGKYKKDIYKFLKAEWKETFGPMEAEIRRENKANSNLKGKSTEQVSTLVDLIKDSKKLNEDVTAMKKIYKARVEMDLIQFAYQKLTEIDPNGDVITCGEIVSRCTQFEGKLKDLQEDLKAIPNAYQETANFNVLGSDEKLSHPLAGQKLVELLADIKERRTAAKNRASDLNELNRAFNLPVPVQSLALNAQDTLLLERVAANFDVTSFHEDQDSLLLAFLSGLQIDSTASEFKNDLRQYIVDNKAVYQPKIAELIQNDILNYMESPAAKPTKIMRDVPALRLIYQQYRREYKAANEAEKIELNSQLEKDCNQDAYFDAYCAEGNAIGDAIAMIALKQKHNVRLDILGNVDESDKLLMAGDESLPVIRLFKTSQGTFDLVTEKVVV